MSERLISFPDIADLADKWNRKAQEHEIAAHEIDDYRDEEFVPHREIAATLRECAQDLMFPEPPKVAEEEIKF